MRSLEGKRILIVEDEIIIAIMAEDVLTELGATVVGPTDSIAIGQSLASTESIDAAVLDVNLNGTNVGPLAQALRARGVPIVFATGYGKESVPLEDAQILDKPYTPEKLVSAVARALSIPK